MKAQQILNTLLSNGNYIIRTKAFLLYVRNGENLENDLLKLAINAGVIEKETVLYN